MVGENACFVTWPHLNAIKRFFFSSGFIKLAKSLSFLLDKPDRSMKNIFFKSNEEVIHF